MPWAFSFSPSPALGALSASLKASRPDIEVKVHSPNLDLAVEIGMHIYNRIGNTSWSEILFSNLVYPQKREAAKNYFVHEAQKEGFFDMSAEECAELFERIREALARQVESVAQTLSESCDVVGFTTSLSQLYASIAVAQRLKELNPDITVVFGGMGVCFHTGTTTLEEYKCVDYVVQGEGELRFNRLINALDTGEELIYEDGIISQAALVEAEDQLPRNAMHFLKKQIENLGELPPPDYDDYARQAGVLGVEWGLPVEGSRGCWWDRVRRTGDPTKTCFFCSLNSVEYREKGINKTSEQVNFLADRYKTTRIRFMDNIISAKEAPLLAEELISHGREYDIFYEARAQISPYDLVCLWRAGLSSVQVGIEGLSTAYLKRIGKGTSTIQNLQAMKTCSELRILSLSNLILDFPGATEEEVAETAHNIRNYALLYEPPSLASFALYQGSTVSRVPENFGVTNVRNHEFYSSGVPDDVLERIALFHLSFGHAEEQADWSPVRDAVADWNKLSKRLSSSRRGVDGRPSVPLSYNDGNTFLVLHDHRGGNRKTFSVNAFVRELYLYCTEIRTERKVLEHFSRRRSPERLTKILNDLVERRLIFREGKRYLSLAVATTPIRAAERIQRLHDEEHARAIAV